MTIKFVCTLSLDIVALLCLSKSQLTVTSLVTGTPTLCHQKAGLSSLGPQNPIRKRRFLGWTGKSLEFASPFSQLNSRESTGDEAKPDGLFIPGRDGLISSEGDANLYSKYPTTQFDYVSAARKRAEEGRAKLREQEAQELMETEKRRMVREAEYEEGRMSDFGPGDLSDYNAASDDYGFEKSQGNDSQGGFEVISLEGDGHGEEDGNDEPTLIIPDGEDDSGLILF
uniref:Uncharacterized protein n=1 Tax=Corethron hystrix TaxID=216773 RepID=A0A6U5DB31_9STRA|mmetsp:Transcript_11011/g.24263  ORF Transcript_11011/g.24263 Transcript_11011/m.24263 type:complete len:227 (+) Transcript_11011:181-861(+)|eukprot:CAMPEP_0113310066 /NCGR_PEP_ID=MMETSP0010_2-20120614/7858_1 /TAXON_ID=216773 ORGANISM="Corethron hystrix, Strain 308" /NCGR_SAMPLE_ID=MMETSP0010_2 /ASSEMBLY_ACC=CAM_ASM_000155 /LENGTH=226 /DNA_ID=CAMNT_0000165443 /DNA_START=178 /DNA_END=858 /DNA_ORIENTATION=+ /assembly_acc=CAM_ASM_000155